MVKRKYFRKNVQLSLTQIQFYSRLFIKNQLKATVISGHFYCKIYQFEPNDSLWASTIYKAESEPSNSQNAMNLKGVSLSDSRARYNNSLKYKKKQHFGKKDLLDLFMKMFQFSFSHHVSPHIQHSVRSSGHWSLYSTKRLRTQLIWFPTEDEVASSHLRVSLQGDKYLQMFSGEEWNY